MALSRKPIEIVAEGNHPLLAKSDLWERIDLIEIADVQNGCAFGSEHFNHDRGMPLIRIRDVNRASTENLYSGPYDEEFVVRKGDLLVGMDGDFRRAFWKGNDALLNQRVCRIIPRTALYETAFLHLVLQPYLNAINEETSSVTVKHLSSRTVSEIPLPLPPLNEQKRIVAKIEELFSELDAGEESLRRARRLLGVYRQSLLKQAFEGKLTAPWRKHNPHLLESPDQLLKRIQTEREARYKEQIKDWESTVKKWEAGGRKQKKPPKPRQPKSISNLTPDVRERLSKLALGWQWAKLGWMTTGPEYGSSAKSKKVGDCPVIRMGNIQRGEINWDDLVFSDDQDEIKQYLLASGDVLFNRTNSPELVGKTAIYRGPHRAIFAGYLVRVNHIGSIVSGDFLTYFLNSHTARQYGNTVKTDGVNQSNINADKLMNYPFPFTSLPEQQEIVRLLDEQFTAIDQNEREIAAALKRSEALRQSILKKAFTGQLVLQDPTDEPAVKLLARIRTEREAAVKAPKEKVAKNTRP